MFVPRSGMSQSQVPSASLRFEDGLVTHESVLEAPSMSALRSAGTQGCAGTGPCTDMQRLGRNEFACSMSGAATKLAGGKCGSDSFDFEAAAFGVDDVPAGAPTGPPSMAVAGLDLAAGASIGTGSACSCSQSQSKGKARSDGFSIDAHLGIKSQGCLALQSDESANRYTHIITPGTSQQQQQQQKRADVSGPASARFLVKVLPDGLAERLHDRRAPSSPHVGTGSNRRAADSTGPLTGTQRLLRELVETRSRFDGSLCERMALEQRFYAARSRLDACRAEKAKAEAELQRHQIDMEYLFSFLDFTRRQVEESEQGLASAQKLSASLHDRDRISYGVAYSGDVGNSSLADVSDHIDVAGSDEVTNLELLRDMQMRAARDRQEATDLAEVARRSRRRRADLQARLQLLLEDQRQAEQDRQHARQDIDVERERLYTMQSERLLLGEERIGVLMEVSRLAQDAGLPPGASSELLRPQPSPSAYAFDSSAAPPAVASSTGTGGNAGAEPGAWIRSLAQPGAPASHQYAGSTAQWQRFGEAPTPGVTAIAAAEKDIAAWAVGRQVQLTQAG